MRRDVNAVDFIEIWLTIVDHIAKVICVTEDVLTRIDENFHLVGYEYLEGNQEDIFLLVKDHGHISELETFVLISLERHPVKLVLGSSLVIVSPNFVVFLKNLHHLLLSFQEILVV